MNLNYGDKFYVFSEYHDYDYGGMDCKEFKSIEEVREYLKKTYKDPEILEGLIKAKAIKIISGREHTPKVTEKVVVKEIELG